MRIAHLVAGAGGMYCGSCLQGATLARAMRQLGEDATVSALYTPLRTDEEEDAPDGTILYGGVNVALQQASEFFAHLPRWLTRQLDRPALLRFAARMGGAVNPTRVAPLCVSMLQGEDGRQHAELERLIDYLAGELKPEIVHLNTVLLVGTAREIRRRLGVPVVATVGGEETFLDRLGAPYRSAAIAVLHKRAGELDAIIAMNRYYAEFMSNYLALPRERFVVIPPGVDAANFAQPDGNAADADPRPQASSLPARRPGVKNVGFLARITPDKGLHLLVEALGRLAQNPAIPPVRILAAGYLAPADRGYLKKILAQVADRGLSDRFEYVGEVNLRAKATFLRSLDALCLPTIHPEAKGLPILEAWACRVPVIVPRHGVFPEMLEETPGGLLFTPGDAASLADATVQLTADAALADRYGRAGQEAVATHYNSQRMARQTLGLYRQLLTAQ